MHSKDFIYLKNEEGFVDISSIMENVKLTYDTPMMKQNFTTDDNIRVFWKPRISKSFSDFGEVITSHLARQFGLPSTKYFFAKWNETKGTISRDYKKQTERQILGRDFLIDYCKEVSISPTIFIQHEKLNNIAFIKEALTYYVNKNKNNIDGFSIAATDAEDILEKLLKNYMFDIAILNSDCHNKNWGLLVDDKTNRVRLIPNMDKERSFLLYNTQNDLLQIVKTYYENPTKQNLDKMELIFKHQSKSHTPELNILPEEEHYGGRGKPYLNSMEELKQMFPNTFEKLLEKFYSLNLSKAFDSVEFETGVKVPQLVKLIVYNAYEARYFEVKEHFGKPKEVLEDDKNLCF